MLIPALVLAALVPLAQEPPPPTAPEPQEPPAAAAVKSSDLPAGGGPGQASIDAGLAAFRKRHFAKAESEFKKALDADPNSAAANFYLGYTYYKIAEPHRRLTPDKQRALELFDKAYALDPGFRPVWQSGK
jgi:tetratricopeptide (TPR) repeat protein